MKGRDEIPDLEVFLYHTSAILCTAGIWAHCEVTKCLWSVICDGGGGTDKKEADYSFS